MDSGFRFIALIMAILALMLTGCVSSQQYRLVNPELHNAVRMQNVICQEDGSGKCGNQSLVKHQYVYDPPNKPRLTGDYYMSYVEFDDQGWFEDIKQQETLTRFLDEQSESQDLLIILFAHGWLHNAGPCDTDIHCFRGLLERLGLLEDWNGDGTRRPRPRTVVGVYVGWRGKSSGFPLVKRLTFWSRKAAAQRVGNGGVNHLVSTLNQVRRHQNPGREPGRTRLILLGHSFGGKVLFSGIKDNLLSNSIGIKSSKSKKKELGVASSIGDLVVLINPAFEGSLYEPLHAAATNRCFPYKQRPAMITLMSEDDLANKLAFPAGRFVSTAGQIGDALVSHKKEQYQSIVRNVGFLDRYITHDLRIGENYNDKKYDNIERKDCGCSRLGPLRDFDLDNWVDIKNSEYAQRRSLMTNNRYGKFELMPATNGRQYSPNHPFLVAKVDERIIKSHSSIYDPDLIDFFLQFFLRHVVSERTFSRECWPVQACQSSSYGFCEQSCRRDDGGSCSGRIGYTGQSSDGISLSR